MLLTDRLFDVLVDRMPRQVLDLDVRVDPVDRRAFQVTTILARSSLGIVGVVVPLEVLRSIALSFGALAVLGSSHQPNGSWMAATTAFALAVVSFDPCVLLSRLVESHCRKVKSEPRD